ncbi:hypothetical protein DFJ74DRAFT_757003 [Hyaloraphidium curvatum]|nr:hypothetical protein DFJ74DRAFT_757003 [Hyaloraphidium curvatum]
MPGATVPGPSVSTAAATKPRSADELHPGRRPHTPDTPLIVLNKLLPIPPHALALAGGLILGSVVPKSVAALAAAAFLAPSVYSLVTELRKPAGQRDSDKHVLKGRYAASLDGEYCVFLIGSRYNGPSKLDKEFGWMGDAMVDIVKDLQENAQETGYLGHETFVGTGKDGADFLLTVYFRSFDHLTNYARSRSNAHAGPWSKLMALGRKGSDYGFWHESYRILPGGTDAIYINCPPIGLGNCIGAQLVPAQGRYASAKGRMGQTQGEDYATELGKPDY